MRLVIFLSLFLFAACSVVRQEIDYPGGIPDFQANRLLPAFSNADRADRYLIALTLLSQLAAETASDGLQAASVAGEINRADRQISELAAAADSTGAQRYLFETMSYDVQASLYALSKSIAINAELEVRLRKLAELDVVWLMSQLVRLRQNVPAARRSAAVYRDITYVVADALAAQCGVNPPPEFQAECGRLAIEREARSYAGLETQPTLGPLHHARNAVRTLMRNPGFNMALQEQHRNALRHHMALACWRLYQIQSIEDLGGDARHCLEVTSRPELR